MFVIAKVYNNLQFPNYFSTFLHTYHLTPSQSATSDYLVVKFYIPYALTMFASRLILTAILIFQQNVRS